MWHVMWHVIHMPVPCCLASSMLLNWAIQVSWNTPLMHCRNYSWRWNPRKSHTVCSVKYSVECQAISIGFIKETLDTGCVLFCIIACIQIYSMIKGPVLNVNKRNRLKFKTGTQLWFSVFTEQFLWYKYCVTDINTENVNNAKFIIAAIVMVMFFS